MSLLPFYILLTLLFDSSHTVVSGNELPYPEDTVGVEESENVDGPWDRTCFQEQHEVQIAIYHLNKERKLYHYAPIVCGIEFHFGVNFGKGIIETEAINEPGHILEGDKLSFEFRGLEAFKPPFRTRMALDEIRQIVTELAENHFNKQNYKFLRNACLEFTFELIEKITGQKIFEKNFSDFMVKAMARRNVYGGMGEEELRELGREIYRQAQNVELRERLRQQASLEA